MGDGEGLHVIHAYGALKGGDLGPFVLVGPAKFLGDLIGVHQVDGGAVFLLERVAARSFLRTLVENVVQVFRCMVLPPRACSVRMDRRPRFRLRSASPLVCSRGGGSSVFGGRAAFAGVGHGLGKRAGGALNNGDFVEAMLTRERSILRVVGAGRSRQMGKLGVRPRGSGEWPMRIARPQISGHVMRAGRRSCLSLIK